MDWVHRRWTCVPGMTILLIMLTAVVMGNVSVMAQTAGSQASSGLITLDVVDADLAQVVRILTADSKANIVIADPEAKQKKVTVMLNEVPLETALRYVVESVGSSWHRTPDGVYIIGGKAPAQPEKVESAPTVPLIDGGSTSHARSSVTEARRDTRVERIPLYNTEPVYMMRLLGCYKDMEMPEPGKPAIYLPGVSQQKADGTLEPLAVPGQSTPPTVDSLKVDLMSAERAPTLGQEAAQMVPPTPGGAVRPGFQQQRPGQPAVPGGPGAQPQQGQTSTSLLPEGIDMIMAYDMDNSLIVRGDDEGISELKSIISMLDIAPKQIMIKAEFVSIGRNDVSSLGIDWDLQRLNSTFSTAFGPGGNVVFGYANGNLMATLRTQLRERKAKLINAPLISTMNNQPANIMFETGVPFTNTQTIFNSQGTPTTVTYQQILPIRSQLWVLPRVNNADNSITVLVQPTMSDTNEAITSGVLPVVNTQSLMTTRRVANGETIVIGGLIRKQDNVNVDKIPLLGDLPLIGGLFRSTSKNNDDRELLIFLTPTIVPEKPVTGSGVGVNP